MPLLKANGQKMEADGADTSISEGTYLTAGASSHAKGSYTQLVASTGFAAGGLLVVIGGSLTGGDGYLIDIATGGSGSEQVIASNIFHYAARDSTYTHLYLPISIRKGTRLSARAQCSASPSKQVRINLIVVSGEAVGAAATTYGADTANSRGTSVTTGSANTKGSWAQLVSATTASHRWGIVMMRGASGDQYLVDIGVGGSGSEQVVIPNLNVRDSGSSAGDPQTYSMPFMVPKGSRVAVRAQSAGGSHQIFVELIMI